MDQDLIQDLEVKIREINVKDFGDFRRKANSYLLRFRENLTNPSESVRRVLNEMQRYSNYEPNWLTEDTRRRLLADIQSLKKM